MSTKGWVGFFLFHLDLELFAKIKKDLVSTHLFNNSRPKQNEKNLLELTKIFNLSHKKTWFLGNNRDLP